MTLMKMTNTEKDRLALELLKPANDRLLTGAERRFVLRVYDQESASRREMAALKLLEKRISSLALR